MKNLIDCVQNDILSYRGKYTSLFEEKLRDYTKSKYVICTNTGTSALYITLLLSRIGQGDEVIIPCLSFVATANAVSYTGAKPHFVDIESEFCGINTKKLRTYLESLSAFELNKIKAIIPVHLFGRPCNMDEIQSIANDYGLIIIEDACQSLGSWYKDKHTGTFGKFGCISFNGNKIITTGGGGAILAQDENLANEARHLITTAKDQSKERNYHNRIAYNFGMPSVNAALGMDQLESLQKRISRNKINSIKLTDQYRIMKHPENTDCNYWMQIIFSDKKPCEKAKPVYTLLPDLPMYRNCKHSNLSVARSIENKIWMIEN